MESKDHAGLPVKGYQAQSGGAVDAVNANKELEERVLRRIEQIGAMQGVDQRWLAIGRTDLEKAFMAINRAIFKPGRVALPEE